MGALYGIVFGALIGRSLAQNLRGRRSPKVASQAPDIYVRELTEFPKEQRAVAVSRTIIKDRSYCNATLEDLKNFERLSANAVGKTSKEVLVKQVREILIPVVDKNLQSLSAGEGSYREIANLDKELMNDESKRVLDLHQKEREESKAVLNIISGAL